MYKPFRTCTEQPGPAKLFAWALDNANPIACWSHLMTDDMQRNYLPSLPAKEAGGH